MSLSISELAEQLGLPCQGDRQAVVSRVSSWEAADQSTLVFLEEKHGSEPLPEDLVAGCILTPASLVRPGWNAILSGKPKIDFARAAALLQPAPRANGERHGSAAIAPSATIGEKVELGPYVTIGENAKIGRGCILHSGVVIGRDCVLGEDCLLFPRVVLYPGVVLKDRVILHAGVVLGADGFGYVFDGEQQIKFPQVGGLVVEEQVEIGANTTIDRGSLGVTRIGRGAKIDNLVQVAHNVEIGQHVVIAAQTGISGSTIIEDYAVIGGQVGFGDHARVEKGAVIGSKAGVLPGKIVRSGEVYWGVPVRPLREYKRLNALFGRLPEMKASLDRLLAKEKETSPKD